MQLWMSMLVLLLFVGCGPGEVESITNDAVLSEPDSSYSFVAFDWQNSLPDPKVVRLCDEAADPEAAPDKINIHCDLEGGSYAPSQLPEPGTSITIMAYNLERGQRITEQLAWLSSAEAPVPDIVLISETDRGCSRSGGGNVLAQWAEQLGMHFVFGVEFVELPRDVGSGGQIAETCEHGNGILSRWPMGNVKLIRHRSNDSWYIAPEDRANGGEPRLGGRMAIGADVKIGDQYLRVYVAHLESRAEAEDVRHDQALEIVEDAQAQSLSVVVGGDMNAAMYLFDLVGDKNNDAVGSAFKDNGFVDSHSSIPPKQRTTLPELGMPIDLMFSDRANFSDPRICQSDTCAGLSDHYPIWAQYRIR